MVLTADAMMHEKLHKVQEPEYQKFDTVSVKMDITTTPQPVKVSKDVNNML